MSNAATSWVRSKRGVLVPLAVGATAVGLLYAVRPGVVRNGVTSPRVWLAIALIVLVSRLVAVLVRRLTGRPRVAAAASNLVILAAVVALLAPSFSQRTLVEALPSSATLPVPSAVSTSAPSAGPTAAAAPAAPAAAAPRRLGAGELEGVGHSASGRTVVYDVDGAAVLRFEDVDIEGSPAPYVHLVPRGSRTPDGGVALGELSAERGSFNYPLPAELDPTTEWTVLVWCRTFATPIAAADLSAA